jgi:hypothetical protein
MSMNIIDLLSDDEDDDDLLLGTKDQAPIFSHSVSHTRAAPATSTAAAVAVAAPKQEPEHDEDDDVLLLGTADQKPIFAHSASHAAAAPVTSTADAVSSAIAVPKQEPERKLQPHATKLGSCHFVVVGTQFYSGTVSIGETVKLEREPKNVSTVAALRFFNVCVSIWVNINGIRSPSRYCYSFAIALLALRPKCHSS